MFSKQSLLAALVCLLVSPYSLAAIMVSVEGVAGSGVTTWTFSGSSTVGLTPFNNDSVRIHDGHLPELFSTGDSWQPGTSFIGPDSTGNFINDSFTGASLNNSIWSATGSAWISIGSDTRQITHLWLDKDKWTDDEVANDRDDFGIRLTRLDTIADLDYEIGEAMSWGGTLSIDLDITAFNPGTYICHQELSSPDDVGCGFNFAEHGSMTLQISAVPLPAAAWFFISGIVGLTGWRKLAVRNNLRIKGVRAL